MVALPIDDVEQTQIEEKPRRYNKKSLAAIVLGLLLIFIVSYTYAIQFLKIAFTSVDESVCPLHDYKSPVSSTFSEDTLLAILNDPEFRKESADKLTKAVQVDTQVGDKPKAPEEDPEYWTGFKKFHKYLKDTFPHVYSKLEVDTVNTYGLVFHWKGSDESLKPVMLTAHQDVVPVQKATLGDWLFPPFLGHYDGEKLYGRGSCDCKNVLVAIMETLDLLVKQGFEPKRGIIAAFGIDEESSGHQGAAEISQYLQKKFGHNSIYALIDEGTNISLDPLSNRVIAMAATAEKGHANVQISITTPGGHSSLPPPHTSIGFMSELITVIEADPYEAQLTDKSPFLSYLQCAAVYNDGLMKRFLKKAILRAGFDKFANSYVVKELIKNPASKVFVATTQAIDIITGGEKSNALPENVVVEINHRIAVESTHKDVAKQLTAKVSQVADKYDLGVTAFGKVIKEKTEKGYFKVDFDEAYLEPSPVSPDSDNVWEYLVGTVRNTFENYVFTNSTEPLIVSPYLMPANTDTRHYWPLTKNIFRFSPMYVAKMLGHGIHSVDEYLEFDAHLQLLSFFYTYIQTVDTAKASN